jgi:hypothetical protein
VNSNFEYQGAAHEAELAWHASDWDSLPYVLMIDGQLVRRSRVRVENLWLTVIPNALVIVLFVLIVYWVLAGLPRR